MSKLQCLVIEDDPVQADIFSTAVKQAGYEVKWINRGATALDFLQENSPHIVILDLHLPEVDGTKILKFIRSQPHLKDTRVIIATADPRMAELVAADSDLVLTKPVSYVQLRKLASRLWQTPDSPNPQT